MGREDAEGLRKKEERGSRADAESDLPEGYAPASARTALCLFILGRCVVWRVICDMCAELCAC